MLTESLVLSLTGGALGLLFAAWGHRLMLGFLIRDPLSVALDFRLDYRLLGVGLVLALTTSLLFGLVPAIRATGAGSAERDLCHRPAGGAANVPLAKGLLAVQMGLSMVLLVGAGLAARSLRNLGAADLGLVRENLMLINVSSVRDGARGETAILEAAGAARVALAGRSTDGAARETRYSATAAGTSRSGLSVRAGPRRKPGFPIIT